MFDLLQVARYLDECMEKISQILESIIIIIVIIIIITNFALKEKSQSTVIVG